MSDVFSFDLADGLASGQCPLCDALARDERRWFDSFWREGRKDAGARRRFFAGGGFCRRHAWLLHDLVAEQSAGRAIADIYGALADRDLAALDDVLAGARDRRRKGDKPLLLREAACSACIAETDALARKAHFFVELLATVAGRERYERSHGLCFTHLLSALDAAGKDDEAALYLIGDWRRRLEEVRRRLSEFDRKRDYRYAGERQEDERRSWTDVIRRYVGDAP